MATFPPLGRGGFVDPIDRSEAIDFVNRVNWFFDAWDLDAMIDAFDENMVVYHPHGTVRGHAELRRFYDAYYPLVPGVTRHATSHVVDVDADLVNVRYHNLLVRYAPLERSEEVGNAETIVEDTAGLPCDLDELADDGLAAPRRPRLENQGASRGATVRNVALSPANLP